MKIKFYLALVAAVLTFSLSTTSLAAPPYFLGSASVGITSPDGASAQLTGSIKEDDVFVAPLGMSFHRISFSVVANNFESSILSIYYGTDGAFMYYGDHASQRPTSEKEFASVAWPINEKTWIKIADSNSSTQLSGTFYPWDSGSYYVEVYFTANSARISFKEWRQNGLVPLIPERVTTEYLFTLKR